MSRTGTPLTLKGILEAKFATRKACTGASLVGMEY
jgi:hypothetical protein